MLFILDARIISLNAAVSDLQAERERMVLDIKVKLQVSFKTYISFISFMFSIFYGEFICFSLYEIYLTYHIDKTFSSLLLYALQLCPLSAVWTLCYLIIK